MLLGKLTKMAQPDPQPRPAKPLGIVRRAPTVQDPAADLPPDVLVQALDAIEQRPEESRLGTPPPFHASSLLDCCPRAYALAHVHGPVVTVPERGMRIVWAIGRAVEQHARTLLVEALGRHVFYGTWSCACRHSQHQGFYPAERRCDVCGEPLHHYGEAVFEDPELSVKGSPDLLWFRNGRFVIVEFKSMNKKKFDALAAPAPFHVAQAGFYRRMMQRLGLKVHERVVVFVVNKDFTSGSGKHPTYKEFHADPEADPLAKRVIDRMEATARELRAYFRSGAVPPRVICARPTDEPARTCPLVGACFLEETSRDDRT